MQAICVLGSTGSIGTSTLDVVLRHPDKYRVVALTGHKNLPLLIEQALLCQPDYLVTSDSDSYTTLTSLANDTGIKAKILCGADALVDVASLPEVDTVMAAIVGAAGLPASLAAAEAGKKVLLANKEALVMSGHLFMQAVRDSGATLLPIDSEHNAIFQCLPSDFKYGDLSASGISKILLTGSGGPFRTLPLAQLAAVTPAQACAHPNWSMGQKISVDSATMMNKGLEFIEACWLFGLQADDIQVVLHPQSVIHSMVQYVDGSVIAQMGNPDMRTPIAYGLSWPERMMSGVAPLDFSQLCDFSFSLPDAQRYPNLMLAIDAFQQGQAATTALNAANEEAVSAFLSTRIGFCDIAKINEAVVARINTNRTPQTLADILAIDTEARSMAGAIINGMS